MLNYKNYTDEELEECARMGVLALSICQTKGTNELIQVEIERKKRRNKADSIKRISEREKGRVTAFAPIAALWETIKGQPVLAPNGVDILPASCRCRYTGEEGDTCELSFIGDTEFTVSANYRLGSDTVALWLQEAGEEVPSCVGIEDALQHIIDYFADFWRPDASFRVDGKRVHFDDY